MTEIDLISEEELDEFVMPENFEPFLAREPLQDENTTAKIALLWA